MKVTGLSIVLFAARRCGRLSSFLLDPGAVIRPVVGEWQPHMPERLDEEKLADWRADRNAAYQLASFGSRTQLARPENRPSPVFVF